MSLKQKSQSVRRIVARHAMDRRALHVVPLARAWPRRDLPR
jgi:hypothetical protein